MDSSAASGLIQELSELSGWLRVDTSLSPLYLPEAFDAFSVPESIKLFVGLTEYFRATVLPQRPRGWRVQLPCVPLTTGELRRLVDETWEGDERRAMKQLSELGSVSASILTYLELTRTIVAEAYSALRDEREAQTNLVEILGATRFKTYRGRRVYHTKCARPLCFAVDSFAHMLECYSLHDGVRRGPEAVPFLVRIARVTCRKPGAQPIPLSEIVTERSRGLAAAAVREELGADPGSEVEIELDDGEGGESSGGEAGEGGERA